MITQLLVCSLLTANGAPAESGQDLLVRANPQARPVDVSNRVVFGMRWREPLVRLGIRRTVFLSFGVPAISERHGYTIAGQGEGKLLALRTRDGKPIWEVEHDTPFETAVILLPPRGILPELAVAVARDGSVLAVDSRTGEEAWLGDVEADSRAPGVLAGNKLLLTTVANKLHALDPATGETLWFVGRPTPSALTVEGHSRPTVSGNRIYVGYSDGYLEAYTLDEGVREWSRPLSFSGAEFVDADADPVVADGRVFAASYSDGLYALAEEDGKTIWHKPLPAVISLAAFNGGGRELIIANSADGYVWGFHRESGELAYRVKLPPAPVSRMLVDRGFVVMAAGNSGLVVLDAFNGRPLQATAVVGSLSSTPVWRGKELAMISSEGYLYTFTFGDPGLVR